MLIPVDQYIRMGEMGIYPGYNPHIQAILEDASMDYEMEDDDEEKS